MIMNYVSKIRRLSPKPKEHEKRLRKASIRMIATRKNIVNPTEVWLSLGAKTRPCMPSLLMNSRTQPFGQVRAAAIRDTSSRGLR